MILTLGLAFLAVIGGGSWLVLRAVLPLVSRKLDLDERQIVLQEKRVQGPPVPASMPPDLVRRVMRWQDKDAQDAERKNLLDLFAETGSWDNVRAVLPKELDDAPVTEPTLGLHVA